MGHKVEDKNMSSAKWYAKGSCTMTRGLAWEASRYGFSFGGNFCTWSEVLDVVMNRRLLQHPVLHSGQKNQRAKWIKFHLMSWHPSIVMSWQPKVEHPVLKTMPRLNTKGWKQSGPVLRPTHIGKVWSTWPDNDMNNSRLFNLKLIATASPCWRWDKSTKQSDLCHAVGFTRFCGGSSAGQWVLLASLLWVGQVRSSVGKWLSIKNYRRISQEPVNVKRMWKNKHNALVCP